MSVTAPPLTTARPDLLAALARTPVFDLVVVGGGATGLGVALDAAQRGLRTLLLEAGDFAQGTSSRSTKLVHGGVRYLGQGRIGLVREALRERATLLRNAPHLVQPLPFVLPAYQGWELPFYGVGLQLYGLLAGRAGLGSTQCLSRASTLQRLPNAQPQGLRGAVQYWDGQFDDARLALALARTAAQQGALLINHCPVRSLLHTQGKVAGVACEDAETGRRMDVQARCVVNATGVWVDALCAMDVPTQAAPQLVTPSQGAHVVVDRAFWPSDHALIVPRTADGRVLFAIPWLGKVLLGTTDTPRTQPEAEPCPLPQEVEFILREAGRYLARPPGLQDIRSAWAGLRPLVQPSAGAASTGKISREHSVVASASGLVTVTGGKWTTYRAMAEDVLQKCIVMGLLPPCPAGGTAHLALIGSAGLGACPPLSAAPGLHSYGAEAAWVQALPGAQVPLAEGITEAMVRFAVRHEYARTVEDVLSRRSRLLLLDAAKAAAIAPWVADILRSEGVERPRTDDFIALAGRYAHPLITNS